MSAEKVLEVMKTAGKALKATEIAEAAGLEKKDVDKAMKQLKEQGKITSPKVCFWEPAK
jgi:predicted transcriptional regulator